MCLSFSLVCAQPVSRPGSGCSKRAVSTRVGCSCTTSGEHQVFVVINLFPLSYPKSCPKTKRELRRQLKRSDFSTRGITRGEYASLSGSLHCAARVCKKTRGSTVTAFFVGARLLFRFPGSANTRTLGGGGVFGHFGRGKVFGWRKPVTAHLVVS